MTSEYKWPIAGATIFTADGGGLSATACIDYGWDKLGRYAVGFARAGQALCAEMVASGIALDTLVYPMLYCYRHAIELQLKYMIPDCCRWLLIDVPEVRGHNLERLWLHVEPALRDVGDSDADRESMRNGAALLKQLDTVDPGGETFRYHERARDGANAFPRRHLNVRVAGEQLQALVNFLDAAHTQLSVELEARDDYEKAMKQLHGDG